MERAPKTMEDLLGIWSSIFMSDFTISRKGTMTTLMEGGKKLITGTPTQLISYMQARIMKERERIKRDGI
jgi:hypothetical protein